MKRLKPQKELINLEKQLSKKISVSTFKQLYKQLKQEMDNYSMDEKLKGGEYEKMIHELSVLNQVYLGTNTCSRIA